MRDIDIAWTAGILEGEGSFMLQNENCPVISCEMTDLDILERLKNLHGGHIHECKKRQEHWKQSWRWTIRWASAAKIMTAILPYMGNRRYGKITDVLVAYTAKDIEKLKIDNLKTEAVTRYRAGESLRKIALDYPFGYETIRREANK